MAKIVVFLGPSLPLAEAEAILEAIYLPPAGQSDLMSAVQVYQPDAIALIDGVFLSSPSTWHKEILYALGQGVAVYGASSMGALRAAETDTFGMVGVGEIYQMYASGALMDDDEVALVHGSAEAGYGALSEPMVNVRATLQLAQEQGGLDSELHQQLIALAKAIYFPERTFAAIFQRAEAAGMPTEAFISLRAFVQEHYVDLKCQDSRLLLERLRDSLQERLGLSDRSRSRLSDMPKALRTPPALTDPSANPAETSEASETSESTRTNFELAQTHLFATMYECDRKVRHQNTPIPLRQIAECVALQASDFDDLNFNSLNRMMAQVLAAQLNLTVEPAEIEQEKKRFCFKHHLRSDPELNRWLQENDLTAAEFQALMQEMATCRRLHRWFLNRQAYQRNVKGLLDELRLQNRYGEWAETAAQQEQVLQEHQVELNALCDRTQSLAELLRDGLQIDDAQIPPIPFQDWVFERGFLNTACLQVALMRAKIAREIEAKEDRRKDKKR